jgi:hypothetical protein
MGARSFPMNAKEIRARRDIPEKCPVYSPWGAIDHVETVTDGIWFVSTPSHGGYKLNDEQNAKIPELFRSKDGWYEEDCEWSIVVFFLPDYFNVSQVADARKTLRSWGWRAWELHFNDQVPIVESLSKGHALFVETHAKDWLTVAAFGDWCETVPKGMVGVVAAIGGIQRSEYKCVNGDPDAPESRYFLVTEEAYAKRAENPSASLVIDPATSNGDRMVRAVRRKV